MLLTVCATESLTDLEYVMVYEKVYETESRLAYGLAYGTVNPQMACD